MMARLSDQALVASPSNPQAVSTEGFDPSRLRGWERTIWEQVEAIDEALAFGAVPQPARDVIKQASNRLARICEEMDAASDANQE